MPIQKTPQFSPAVARRALEKHGLEGKVTADQLAEAAREFDTKNQGYISGDEFEKAAAKLSALDQAPLPSASAPAGGRLSPMFARTAAIQPPAADLGDPQIAFAKERILANVGPGERFGELDGGDGGLRAFTIDAATLAKIGNSDLDQKLEASGDGAVFGVLTTGDNPVLTLARASADQVRVAAKLDLLDAGTAAALGGGSDALARVADLFGQAPAIPLGGEKPSWSLASSDWPSGAGLQARNEKKQQAVAARDAARAARRQAQDEALAGPTTLAAFEALGVPGHRHTAAEKKALLDLVKKNAGEDQTFPNPNDSYYGLHVFLLEGAAAQHAVAFAQAGGAGKASFDPATDSVLVTMKSFDEAQIGTYVVDREAGKVKYGDETNAVDLDTRAVEKFFPDADLDGSFDGTVIATLAKRGERLGVVAGDDAPDEMDFSDWG